MAPSNRADTVRVMGPATPRRLAALAAGFSLLLAAVPAGASGSQSGALPAAGRSAPPRQLWLHGGRSTLFHAFAVSPDYRSALWEPASAANYTASDRGLGDIQKIVIHVAEGGFASTYQWFKNPAAQASAHFVVSSTGAIAQMVPERDIAWHAGNWDVNVQSVGIEHAGYTNHTHFPDIQYRSSARLAGTITARYLIPPDRQHVIGHSEVPDPFHRGEFGGADHHTDPGSTWDWPRYMAYLRLVSAQTWSGTVDDGDAGVAHSAAWTTSTGSSSYGGSYLSTASHRADPVSYTVRLPHDDTYDVFVRWPCAAQPASGVAVRIETAAGTVRRSVSQSHCAEWRYLGSWAMTAGRAPRVLIGSHSGNGASVAADAVRLVETTDPVPPAAVQATATPALDGLSFAWPASHDDIGVGAYQLWVDGLRAYEGSDRSVTVPEPCGTRHTVSLRAVDMAGNRSARQPFGVSTLPCPEPVMDLHVTAATKTSVTLSWQSGGGTVSGYLVYIAGGALLTQTATPGVTLDNLVCGTTYTFSVRATDAVGDRSARTLIDATTAPC
jgi:N-acetyl-anhydromuramyl-L-alanine amidase AmpD